MPGFSYNDPARIQLYIHFAVASGAGTGEFATARDIRPPDGWEVVLTTDDGVNSPAPGTSLAVFDTSASVPTMQATAFRNLSTGEIVIAYRGTDDEGELSFTSIPLGAGLPEAPGYATESYLQAAYDFYVETLTSFAGGDRSLLSFAGSSLGGIVAGAMGAITGLEALTLSTGPHTLVLGNLLPLLTLTAEDAARTPDDTGVFNLRIAGEVLNDAIELVRTLVELADLAASLGLLSPQDAAAVDALLDQFGDGARIGTNLAELNAGSAFRASLLEGLLAGDVADAILLHFAASVAFQFHAQAVLGYSNYQSVDGFSKALFDPALFAGQASDITAPLAQLTSTVLDGAPDVLTPLLTAVETHIFAVQDVDFGPDLTTATAESIVPRQLARLLVEYAFQTEAAGQDFASPVTDHGPGWVEISYGTMFDSNADSAALTELIGTILPGLAGAITPEIDTILAQASPLAGPLSTGATNDLVLSGEQGITISTGGGSDIVLGGAGADVIMTGAQDDIIIGGRGGQSIDGGTGSDWLVYTMSDLGVNVDLAAGTGFSGFADQDVISNVENLLGSTHDDQLTGDAQQNFLYGDGGRDILFGGAGADMFIFLAGSDIDILGDFSQAENDRILLDSSLALDFDDLLAQGADVSGGTVFSFTPETSLGIAGFTLTEFTADDFVFI